MFLVSSLLLPFDTVLFNWSYSLDYPQTLSLIRLEFESIYLTGSNFLKHPIKHHTLQVGFCGGD